MVLSCWYRHLSCFNHNILSHIFSGLPRVYTLSSKTFLLNKPLYFVQTAICLYSGFYYYYLFSRSAYFTGIWILKSFYQSSFFYLVLINDKQLHFVQWYGGTERKKERSRLKAAITVLYVMENVESEFYLKLKCREKWVIPSVSSEEEKETFDYHCYIFLDTFLTCLYPQVLFEYDCVCVSKLMSINNIFLY